MTLFYLWTIIILEKIVCPRKIIPNLLGVNVVKPRVFKQKSKIYTSAMKGPHEKKIDAVVFIIITKQVHFVFISLLTLAC